MESSASFAHHYLQPYRKGVAVLAAVIFGTIAFRVATPIAIGRFIDQALAGASTRLLAETAIAALACSLLAQALSVVETRIAEDIGWSATNDIRLNLTAHVLRLDHAFHTSHTSGELIERVDGDAGQLTHFFSRFAVNIVGNALLSFGILIWLATIDWRLALSAASFALIAILVMIAVRSRATPVWAEERAASAGFYGFLSEHLKGLEDIRASGASARAYVIHGFLQRLRSWLPFTNRAGMWGYLLGATNSAVFALALASTLSLGGYLYRSDALTLGALFVAVRLTDMLRDPVVELRRQIQLFQQAAASLGRVRELLALEPTIKDGSGSILPAGTPSITWDAVNFAYGDHDPVLRNITLEIPAGRILGLIGRTGSGKTTLARLVPRLIDPDDGAILLSGIDIRSFSLAELRSRIGVVTQETNLFDGTLEENLTLFGAIPLPDTGRLVAILNQIGLEQWLSTLPNGLATRLGEGGLNVSAGEAQLIACARVLLRDPDIVILDEASARLDPITGRKLHDAFSTMLAGRTGILIAHRLETLALADDIAVLSDGVLIEFGARSDLMSRNESRYAELLSHETWAVEQ
jgi:ABC-type multidrug transport system fused ATPase/permease subunit